MKRTLAIILTLVLLLGALPLTAYAAEADAAETGALAAPVAEFNGTNIVWKEVPGADWYGMVIYSRIKTSDTYYGPFMEVDLHIAKDGTVTVRDGGKTIRGTYDPATGYSIDITGLSLSRTNYQYNYYITAHTNSGVTSETTEGKYWVYGEMLLDGFKMVTISFDPNGGTGTMESMRLPHYKGLFVTTLPQCTFTPPAGTNGFYSWMYYEDGDPEPHFQDPIENKYYDTPEEDRVYYAAWSKHLPSIQVTYSKPTVGKAPTTTFYISNRDDYKKVIYDWSEIETGNGFAKFEAGKEYELTLWLYPQKWVSYDNDNNIPVSFNGQSKKGIYDRRSGYVYVNYKFTVSDGTYTVSFDKNGGSGTMYSVTVDQGSSYILPECAFTAPDNKRFKYWKIGGSYYSPGDTVTINSDTTVLAQWKGKYTITYDPNGGTGTMAPETYNEGDKYVIPACRFTPPTDMIFGGWLVDGRHDSVGNYWNVYSDHVLKPQWIPSSGIAERVDITVTAPKANELPSYDVTVYGAGNVITGNEVPVSGSPGVYTQYKGVLWRDLTTRKNQRSNAAFVDGHEYRVSVDLKSLVGTTFNFEDDSKPMTQIYINGSAAEIQPAAMDNTICTAMYTFTKGSTVSGTQTSYLDNSGTVTVQLMQGDTEKYSATVTGNTGSYSIANVASGSYTLRVSKKNHVTRDYAITVSGDTTQDVKICPIGDVDNNGRVNAADAKAAFQHGNEQKLITDDYKKKCADVTSPKNRVNSADAKAIFQHANEQKFLWTE